jgi:hypothetical protein
MSDISVPHRTDHGQPQRTAIEDTREIDHHHLDTRSLSVLLSRCDGISPNQLNRDKDFNKDISLLSMIAKLILIIRSQLQQKSITFLERCIEAEISVGL